MGKILVFLTVLIVFIAWSFYRFQLISIFTNFEDSIQRESDFEVEEETATWTEQRDAAAHQENQEEVEIPIPDSVHEILDNENKDFDIFTSWQRVLMQLETEKSNKEFPQSESQHFWTSGQPVDSVQNANDFKLAFEELRITLEYPGEHQEASLDNGMIAESPLERQCSEDEREAWILLRDFVQIFSSTMKNERNDSCSKFTSICGQAEEVFSFPLEFFLPADSFPEGAQPEECPLYLDQRLLEIAKAFMKFKESQVCPAVTTFCQNV